MNGTSSRWCIIIGKTASIPDMVKKSVRVDPDHVSRVRRTLTQEVMNAAGLPQKWWGKSALDAALWLPTWRFARKMVRFDADVAGAGLPWAARNLLHSFVDKVMVWGTGNIPSAGPVLLASNHPGAYDSFAVVSALRRDDLCVVASGVDFTHSLPATARHLIYVTPDPGVRMAAVRQALRHLQQGGMMFIFPTGLVDPDPALWPDQAFLWLQDWSHSLAVFLKRAPETRLVIAIASHILVESCVRHPLTRLVHGDWQRRRLAEYIQVFQQLVFNRRFGIKPRISFTTPHTVETLSRHNLHKGIVDLASKALQDHLNRDPLDFTSLDDGTG